jgi:hypothetical protein
MDNPNRDEPGKDNPSSGSDSDVTFGKNRGHSDIEEIDRQSQGEVERYEDTTPMSNRGALSEH